MLTRQQNDGIETASGYEIGYSVRRTHNGDQET